MPRKDGRSGTFAANSGFLLLDAADGGYIRDYPMQSRARPLLLATLVSLAFAPASLRGQQITPVTPAGETQAVRQAAFTLWWPEYDRLMREFRRNTPADAGTIALPEPSPDAFFYEIEILGRIAHPAIADVSLYSVSTEGDIFQALFVVSESDRAWALVNRVDPAGFRQEMTNPYIEGMNALLERHDVEVGSAETALELARFAVEVFYNFDYRYEPSSVDSLTFAELNRVRVLDSTDDIPQGVRRFDAEGGNALLYGRIPERVRGTVSPPRVLREEDGYGVIFSSWHPQTGELKRWEIRMTDTGFVSLKDRTIEKWAPFSVENF